MVPTHPRARGGHACLDAVIYRLSLNSAGLMHRHALAPIALFAAFAADASSRHCSPRGHVRDKRL